MASCTHHEGVGVLLRHLRRLFVLLEVMSEVVHRLLDATRSGLPTALEAHSCRLRNVSEYSTAHESGSHHYADLWGGQRDPRTFTEKLPAGDLRDAATMRAAGQMTTFLQPDEATNVDFAEPRQKRDRDRVACFLHLRDLVYLHPKAASADAIAFVQKLEAAVIAEKAAREKRLAEVCKREAERRQEADRQKAAVERAKAESQLRE